MADETKVTIKAKVAQKIIEDGDTSYLPVKGELVAVKKGENISLSIGQEKENITKLQELNYIEGPVSNFYITAGKDPDSIIGDYATAEGYGTIANHRSQNVFGEYNIADDGLGTKEDRGTYIEIVGNGNKNDDETISRSNARTLDWNGNEVLSGKLTVGAGPNAAKDVTTKEYVDGSITNISRVVTSNYNGLVPKIESTELSNLVFGCTYNDGQYKPQWLKLGEGGISIVPVSANNDGIVPKYGALGQQRVLTVNTSNNVEWLAFADLEGLTPEGSALSGKYLESHNGNMIWSEPIIVDDSSYNGLVDIINSPIDFLQKKQLS